MHFEIVANFLQYIIDGGIHADLPTGNVQTTIMVVAEAAVAKIMAQ
jgi:cellobiose dehydrogenase (acceptor)